MLTLGTANKIKQELCNRFGERCLFEEELKSHTSYQIGGRADFFIMPATVQEWRFIFNFCKFHKLPLTILGYGTNVLISDDGIQGITAATNLMKEINIDANIVTAKAGTLLDDLIKISIERGLAGLEKMSGIPGSVGGAVGMNAGAFGQEILDNLIDLQVLCSDGSVNTLTKKDIEYSYRKVEGMENLLILSARWQLNKSPVEKLKQTRKEILLTRLTKQPLDYPSAGSVFKRPKDNYASQLIDLLGLKGTKSGNAQISNKHAGFIINLGNARAKDVYQLIDYIRQKVKKEKNIELELEQKLLGKFEN
jgi:UDP-N-acetylmuramate dehydrogenase